MKNEKSNKVPYNGIDFLLAGFVKCGTTSLYDALRGVDDIYLSDRKESHYFYWDDGENNLNKLIRNFFSDIREGQLVGMIEPSFSCWAEDVHRLWGDKLRVLFLVRNPVYAAFSLFKMINRTGEGGVMKEWYQKTGQYYDGMYDVFFEQYIKTEGGYLYIDWIEQFRKYYPEEQTKIIIYEELIENPEKIMNDILEYIGSSAKYNLKEFPRKNAGDYVLADLEGYKAANSWSDMHIKCREAELEDNHDQNEQEREHLDIIQKYREAKRIYGVKMTEGQINKSKAYFNDSVRRLEQTMGKDLSDVWF